MYDMCICNVWYAIHVMYLFMYVRIEWISECALCICVVRVALLCYVMYVCGYVRYVMYVCMCMYALHVRCVCNACVCTVCMFVFYV